jgi:hypothetical protein
MSSNGPEPGVVPGAAAEPGVSTDPGAPEVAPGVRLRLPAPLGAREEPAADLPAVDLSSISGARITLRRGLEDPAARLRLRILCATAPSDRWAPGVEELVLDRASGLARGAVAGAVERWESAPLAWTGDRFEQRFEGLARDGAAALSIRGRHLLGFAGGDRAALLCSVICAEPVEAPLAARAEAPLAAPAAGQPGRCAPLVDAVALEGALAPPPPPSLLVRGILAAAEHPYPAAAILGVLAAAAVAILLARRPKPRPVR